MSKEVIYVGDIIPSKSIIGTLDGSEMFCVATPYFDVPGVRKPDPKKFLEQRSASKYGVMLAPAEIYVRSMPSRPFTSRFSIGWTKARGVKKSYFFMKLYEVNTIPDKFKHKLIITPEGQYTDDDAKLCIFDYQMAMIMDILFVSKIVGIDLSTYKDLKDNSKFFAKFCADILTALNKLLDKSSQIGKEDFKLPKSYIDSFVNTPTFMSRDKKYFPIEQLGKPKSEIKSLWSIFYDLYSSNDLESKFTTWKSVIKSNATAIPSFRFIDIINKQSQAHEKRFDARLSIIQKLDPDNKNFNANIKDFLITQRCLGPKKFEPITQHNFATLWGSTEENPALTKGVVQTGCVFLIPQLEFKYYNSGNPTLEWRVEQLAVKKTSGGGGANGYDDAAAFVDDDDNDNGGGDAAAQFNDDAEIPI